MKSISIFSFIIILLCASSPANGQIPSEDAHALISQGENLRDQGKKNEALSVLKRAYDLSRKENLEEEILRTGRIITSLYIDRNEYKNVLQLSDELIKLAEEKEKYRELSSIYRDRSIAYKNLGLADQSYREIRKSITYASKIEDDGVMHYYLSLGYVNLSAYFENREGQQDSVLYYMEKSLREAKEISDNGEIIKQHLKYDMIISLNMNIGNYYMGIHQPQRVDLAEKYYLRGLEFRKTQPDAFLLDGMSTLNQLGRFYEYKGEYGKAVTYANEVLGLEKHSFSPSARMLAYATLANSYEGLSDQGLALKYTKLYTYLSDSLSSVQKRAVNTPVEKIISEKEKEKKDSVKNLILISLVGIGILALIIWMLWRKKQNAMRKSYELLTEQLKNEKTDIAEECPEADTEEIEDDTFTTGLNIPDETQDNILQKLYRFEKNHQYLKQDISLTSLAGSWNTNTNYLSQVIRQHKGKSFNNYLSELRIKHVVNLLYMEPKFRDYKISYLAESCGFASREVFTRAFKKETGFPPLYFIESLRNDEPLK